jgi:hypothetical protein
LTAHDAISQFATRLFPGFHQLFSRLDGKSSRFRAAGVFKQPIDFPGLSCCAAANLEKFPVLFPSNGKSPMM